jgi:hypothetical protein
MVVKGNQPTLCANLEAAFDSGASHGTNITFDHGHGREEIRRVDCLTIHPTDPIVTAFPDVHQIARIIRDRTVCASGSASQETSYAIFSRDAQRAPPAVVAQAARLHWAIENNVHWRRDTRFAEDDNRTRIRHSPYNLACLRNWAITVVNGLTDLATRFTDRCKALRYDPGLGMSLVGIR